MLLELELAEGFLELGVRDGRLAGDLRADERQVVLEVDRARAQVAGLDRRHLRGALAAGAGDGVVHLDRVRAPFQDGVVGHAPCVHQLVLLELVDQGGEGLEGEAQALLERGSGQLIGERERPEEKARHKVAPDMQIFETLRSLDRPGYHRAHILHFGTQVQTQYAREGSGRLGS